MSLYDGGHLPLPLALGLLEYATAELRTSRDLTAAQRRQTQGSRNAAQSLDSIVTSSLNGRTTALLLWDCAWA